MKYPVPIEPLSAAEEATSPFSRVALDARLPRLLDQRDRVWQVVSGYVDVFAVIVGEQGLAGARHHLFRVESGGILLALSHRGTANDLGVIAVGGQGAEALDIPRTEFQSCGLINDWITKLAQLAAGTFPDWNIAPAESDACRLEAGERLRGPVREIFWASVQAGGARPMGFDPLLRMGDPPFPLTSGMWIAADHNGCDITKDSTPVSANTLWPAIDQFHRSLDKCFHKMISSRAEQEEARLTRRRDETASQSLALFERMSSVIRQNSDDTEIEAHASDALLSACQHAAHDLGVLLVASSRPFESGGNFSDVLRIARAAGLRVRQTLLRGEWWKQDAGPLVAWHGDKRVPVALIWGGQGRYVMIDAGTGGRRAVDPSTASELAVHAAAFYPALPSGSLSFRDLLTFSLRYSGKSIKRIAMAMVLGGLLGLVGPMVTEVLVNSVIPRTELDQLAFCIFALTTAAFASAGVQVLEGVAMLRLEGLIDWKLQAAMIDRMLRMPTSLFRDFTIGELVNRSMGIDAARRIFTGYVLRGLLSGMFCWVSLGLMFYYDAKLGLVALLMTGLRAVLIVSSSAIRLRYENKLFDLQNTIGGFVLQMIAGVAKLRVADASTRALAVWSKKFAVQRMYFTSSQRTANALGIVESIYPTFATLVVFSVATSTNGDLFRNIGSFLAFFTAFGQSMAFVSAWASGISAALVAIPHLTRLKPLIADAIEVSEERKPPGDLSGAIELSRVTFRYSPSGPPILDNVSLRIAPGEYVAIVGPSGSGKSTLFRLLLGFEKAESGAVFFDGKALDTLDVNALRRQFGVVLQNGTLATGSIFENICGGSELSLEDAWQAARLAGLDADINAMPMGMHTVVAEGASTLSGGQKQRIMIARAVARRPRILLFDEATSALDNQTQATVSTTLGNLNVTRIIIAHRLSTVRRVDRIIVVADGKIVQSGSFDELSAAPGMFASFAQRQLL